ncbi:hypothetical protein [Clostridium oryzae]|uniref:Uncharacterized protein n=1 Tax=Clostridium oryzae TaxID=1450648 RepID=A0A1V4ICV0_9CLOT|nr:hypothetical protein [Clostridium oryzae]OPJ57801.1 hypothetical protein CLORY_39210 [Clostridium oryzae]
MKINFTKKQYRKLLDLIYAGEMVVNSVRDSEEKLTEYEELEQYMYSFAKDFGFDDLFKYDVDLDSYMLTEKYEDEDIFKYINDYDNYVFWQQLAARLSTRDALLEINKDKNKKQQQEPLTDKESNALFKLQTRFEKKYYREFDKHGLNNVNVELKR